MRLLQADAHAAAAPWFSAPGNMDSSTAAPTILSANTRTRRSRIKEESGTCPSGTDEPPGKATFNATLRCKIVAGQAAHKLADALPADIRESGHGQQSVAPLATLAPQLPAHRAGLSPTAPRGHNRPGAAVPARALVPRIRVH